MLLCLGFSNTSHVDILDSFRKAVVENIKPNIHNLMKQKHSKEERRKIGYSALCSCKI